MTSLLEDAPPIGKEVKIVTTLRGYAHTTYSGTCGPDVTVQDIQKRFYHSHFGGRGAWVSNGQWGATRHDD